MDGCQSPLSEEESEGAFSLEPPGQETAMSLGWKFLIYLAAFMWSEKGVLSDNCISVV